jgi:hypothetical protein
MNGLFKLGWKDLLKGVYVAVGAALIVAVAGIVMTSGFDAFATNWILVGHNMVNTGIVAGCGYLLKQLFTDNNGVVLGANLG